MTITLYNCADEPNRLTKTLSSGYTPTIANNGVNTELGVTRPIITIIGNISGYNYAEIADFGRYYFIDSITIIRNGISQLNLRVDPLMSFRADIAALPAVLIRSQDTGAQSEYLIDSKRPILAYQVRETYEIFTFHGTAGTCILVTAG